MLEIRYESRHTKWFKSYLYDAARDLGIQKGVKVEEINDPDDITVVDSHRYSSEHTVKVHGILYRDSNEVLIYGPDGKTKAPKRFLSMSDQSAIFFGIQALQHISLNTNLYKKAAQVCSLILGVTFLNSVGVFSESGIVNTLLQGLTIKLFQCISEGVVERYQTFRADEATASYTQDKKGAVQALLILKRLREDLNLGSFPQGFVSIDERIEALDPNHEISLPDLTHCESSSVDLSKATVPLDPQIQKMKEFKAYVSLGTKVTPSLIMKFGMAVAASGSPLWPIPLALKVLPAFFPTSIPAALSPVSSLEKVETSKVKDKATAILQDMGSTAPVPQVYVGGEPATIGDLYGTGQSALIVPSNFEGETPEEDFVLRHEMAHLVNRDNLIKAMTVLFATVFVHATYSLFEGDETSYSDMMIKGVLVMAVQFIAMLFVSRAIEARADRTAVVTASNPKRVAQGGVQFMKGQQEKNRKNREDMIKGSEESKILAEHTISSEGENRLDWEHPSLQSRVDQMKSMTS